MKNYKDWITFFKEKYGSLTIEEWMTSAEAADYLRMPIGTLRNQTSIGVIPYTKLGRSNRYHRDDLRNLLLSQKRGGLNGN